MNDGSRATADIAPKSVCLEDMTILDTVVPGTRSVPILYRATVTVTSPSMRKGLRRGLLGIYRIKHSSVVVITAAIGGGEDSRVVEEGGGSVDGRGRGDGAGGGTPACEIK